MTIPKRYLDFRMEYDSWRGMRDRCGNPQNTAYHRYGGAGVRVCDEWTAVDGFEVFLGHIGRRPSKDHTIDRIDNSRGYEPGNVRWATVEVQNRNRRSTRFIEAHGLRLCIAEWAKRSGLGQSLIIHRLNRLGWDPVRAVTESAVHGRNGQTKLTESAVQTIRQRRAGGETLLAIAAAFGVSESTVCRIARTGHSAT